jgi:hypothetical protein
MITSVDAHEVRQPATAGRVQLRHDAALGAQHHAVRRVLDVAADQHPAVVGERRGAHLEAAVGRVGVRRHLDGGVPQRLPVDVVPRHRDQLFV